MTHTIWSSMGYVWVFGFAIVAGPVTLPYLTLTVPNNITKERKKKRNQPLRPPIRGVGIVLVCVCLSYRVA